MWKNYYNYEVSDSGEVRNSKTKYILKGNVKKTGYVEYCLYIDGKKKTISAHRLIASLFLDNFDANKTINHIDGNKENNSISNLECVTSSENNQHAWNNSLNKPHILRPVLQYDLKHNFIQRFESVSEAKKATGASKIREVANGDRNQSGGYIWKWAEDFIPEDRGKSKKVALLNDEGEIIQIFDSVSQAARETNSDRHGITAVCVGKQKKYNNYYWKFINDDMIQ